MSKVNLSLTQPRFLFSIFLFFLAIFFSPRELAIAQTAANCSDINYTVTTNPVKVELGQPFSVTVTSKDIKQIKSDFYYKMEFRKTAFAGDIITGTTQAVQNGAFQIPGLKLPGEASLAQGLTYEYRIYESSGRGSARAYNRTPLCKDVLQPTQSSLKPAKSCQFTTIINKQKKTLTIQGHGDITRITPPYNSQDNSYKVLYFYGGSWLSFGTAGGNRINIDTNDGTFGPVELNIPPNFPGGNTVIRLQHSWDNTIVCESVVDLPSTTPPSKVCKNQKDKTFNPSQGDTLCSTAGGSICPDDGRGPAIKTAIGCIHTNPTEFVKDFLTFIIGIGGGLAFLMMLLGVFQMLTSAGNPETLSAGRDRLQSAIIGLLFIIFAVLLLRIIGVDILGLGKQFGL